ncbi:hypothetical protein SDC9_111482 [bioreactor metagenome]|uniref:Uncharacterized protein n=1 Tax=bioreactor metagenome TaxID=1076179 RepID=A0A645BGU3_9ZZZZ
MHLGWREIDQLAFQYNAGAQKFISGYAVFASHDCLLYLYAGLVEIVQNVYEFFFRIQALIIHLEYADIVIRSCDTHDHRAVSVVIKPDSSYPAAIVAFNQICFAYDILI